MRAVHRSMQRLIVTLALALVSIALPASTRAEERYMDGLDLTIDRVQKRVDEISAARRAYPDRFEFVAPYLCLVESKPVDGLMPINGWPQEMPRLDKPEFFDPRHAELVARYPDAVSDIAGAIENGATWGNGSRARQKAIWTGELWNLQAKHGLSDQDFSDLLVGMGGPDACPRLNKDHQLVWEEVVISRVNWGVKIHALRFVASYCDPASLPILGEIARSVIRERLGGWQTPFAEAVVAIIQHPGRNALIELSDTMRLTPDDRRNDAREYIGTLIDSGGDVAYGDTKETAKRWSNYLAEAEKDPDLRDHVARLRDAVEFYKQKKAEREKK